MPDSFDFKELGVSSVCFYEDNLKQVITSDFLNSTCEVEIDRTVSRTHLEVLDAVLEEIHRLSKYGAKKVSICLSGDSLALVGKINLKTISQDYCSCEDILRNRIVVKLVTSLEERGFVVSPMAYKMSVKWGVE